MRAVQDALPARTDDGAGTLPVDAEAFMVAHSGISMSDEAIAVAGQRLAARRIAEAAQTLDTAAVAALLGVHRTRVQHLRNDGGLFAYRDGRFNRYPLWQFTDHARPLPGLRQVLAALGPAHRSVVIGFIASAHPELDTGAGPVSARDWLPRQESSKIVCPSMTSTRVTSNWLKPWPGPLSGGRRCHS